MISDARRLSPRGSPPGAPLGPVSPSLRVSPSSVPRARLSPRLRVRSRVLLLLLGVDRLLLRGHERRGNPLLPVLRLVPPVVHLRAPVRGPARALSILLRRPPAGEPASSSRPVLPAAPPPAAAPPPPRTRRRLAPPSSAAARGSVPTSTSRIACPTSTPPPWWPPDNVPLAGPAERPPRASETTPGAAPLTAGTAGRFGAAPPDAPRTPSDSRAACIRAGASSNDTTPASPSKPSRSSSFAYSSPSSSSSSSSSRMASSSSSEYAGAYPCSSWIVPSSLAPTPMSIPPAPSSFAPSLPGSSHSPSASSAACARAAAAVPPAIGECGSARAAVAAPSLNSGTGGRPRFRDRDWLRDCRAAFAPLPEAPRPPLPPSVEDPGPMAKPPDASCCASSGFSWKPSAMPAPACAATWPPSTSSPSSSARPGGRPAALSARLCAWVLSTGASSPPPPCDTAAHESSAESSRPALSPTVLVLPVARSQRRAVKTEFWTECAGVGPPPPPWPPPWLCAPTAVVAEGAPSQGASACCVGL